MPQRLDENQGRSDFFSSIKTLAFGFLAERFEGLTTGLGAHLIRPPGALDELSFLSSCTRCDKCIEACPQDALIKADAKTGLAVGSPHIDPRRTPCFLCTELPCVTACPEGALVWPTRLTQGGFNRSGPEAVFIGTAEIASDLCLTYEAEGRAASSCQVCVDRCPYPNLAIKMEFNEEHTFAHPEVVSEFCTGCGLCVFGCPTDPAAIKIIPKQQLN
ncbi:MAG: 4Fe-4S dicluster domain-containing protein [Holophagaceae bacterium]